MFDYKNFLLTVPEMPGCYIMKDERDTIIYIGKAKNLKNRLKNYFPPVTDSRLFVTFLLDILKNVEIIVTKSEYDAIILEITLIKLHKPKYNIVYKDSSPELYLYLNEKNVYQTLEFTNVFVRDEKYCIGPFFSSFKVKEIVDTLNKAFLLRSCSDNVFKSTKRVCLEYHIKRCSGACENKISKEDYFKSVENLKRFLNGEHKELLKELKEDMLNASENLLFEKAIKLRDEIKVLEYFITKKFKYIEKKINIDIVSYSKRGESIALTIIVVRNGLIIDQKIIEYNDIFIFESEIITSFIIQYYNNKINFPAKVIIANDDINLTELNDFFINKFVLKAPESEEEIKLSSMAKQNGDIYLEKEYFLKDKNDILLKSIMNTFSLINYPDIIECFDNSNLFGKNPVASKVEFRNGFPFKKGYKLYKIKTIDKPDDYGTMKEVIKRRLTKGIKENELPDLIVVDGGKGQLNAAYEIFKELNVEDKIDLLSIAKIKSSDSTKDQYYERVFKVGDSEPIILKQNSDEVILFVKLRDEAHRFAITFHKKLRDEKTIKSILDDIEGIGPKRKKILLKHFKSIENIKKATLEELQKVEGVPKDLAKKIFNFFI